MSREHPLFPEKGGKDAQSRIRRYQDWLDTKEMSWTDAPLNQYRDDLLETGEIAPATVSVYVAAVKRQYRRLLDDPEFPNVLRQMGVNVEQAINNMQAALHPKVGKVKFTRDVQVEHLTLDQVHMLIRQIGCQTLKDVRDRLVIGLILFTGMSEVEVCALERSHIELEGSAAIVHVPEVSGGKARTIPVKDSLFYKERWWATYLRYWLANTSTEQGGLFRGFYHGGNNIRQNRLHPTAVRDLIRRYPVFGVAGERTFTAMDLRRTNARWLYIDDTDVDTIRDYFGYESNATVITAIGLLDAETVLRREDRIESSGMIDELQNLTPSWRKGRYK
jgi:integrase